jgi:hypothetical protein
MVYLEIAPLVHWNLSVILKMYFIFIHVHYFAIGPLGILKTEKSRVRDCFISYSKYSRRGTVFIQKKVGSALTETENWDLLVDCTSRDAGVHLSDKRTLLMKTQITFQTQYTIFYRIRFCFYKWWRNNRFYYF